MAGNKVIAFDNPCGFFHEGKAKASTLSLSVLVAIEMFNALNALSEVCFFLCSTAPNPICLPECLQTCVSALYTSDQEGWAKA